MQRRNFLLLHVLVDVLAVFTQVGLKIANHQIDPLRVRLEDPTPISDEHNEDKAPESIFLVRDKPQYHTCDEVHALAVTRLRVICTVGFQYIEQAVFATLDRLFELLITRECPS